MRRIIRLWFCGALIALYGALSPLTAHAHPHAWIDLKSTVIFDAEGRITALTQEWSFDEFYSAFVMEGINADDPELNKVLQEVTRSNLENLREFDYFTLVRTDGQKVDLADVTDFDGGTRDRRYWMRFTIPFKAALDPRAHDVSFAVFDPTYYIEILYAPNDPLSLTGTGASGCRANIIAPTPNMDVIGLAAGLDATESAGNALGENFADKVMMICQ